MNLTGGQRVLTGSWACTLGVVSLGWGDVVALDGATGTQTEQGSLEGLLSLPWSSRREQEDEAAPSCLSSRAGSQAGVLGRGSSAAGHLVGSAGQDDGGSPYAPGTLGPSTALQGLTAPEWSSERLQGCGWGKQALNF